jgi:hypothetical protein
MNIVRVSAMSHRIFKKLFILGNFGHEVHKYSARLEGGRRGTEYPN